MSRQPKAGKPGKVRATSAPARTAALGTAEAKRKRAKPGTAELRKRGGRPRLSKAEAETKRRHILEAALQVFSQHGFEAARIDEVARIAGVAKGTLYLYHPNKQSMFEALVRSAAEPLLGNLSTISRDRTVSADVLLDRIFELFRREILGTHRKLIIRLIISEGPRFPELAAFYHREVISPVLSLLSAVAANAHAQGKLAHEDLVRFPQLIAAPLLLSVVWDGLFEEIDPLDVEGLLATHARLLISAKRRRR